MAGSAIPVIDLSPLRVDPPDPAALGTLAEQLAAACRSVGFFYITSHGLSQADIEAGLELSRRFFDLPAEEKAAVDARQSPLSRGYNSLEQGRHNCTPEEGGQDLKESFTVGMERVVGDPRPPSPMHGPNLWPSPTALPGWRQGVEATEAAFLAAARLLMRALALSLGLPQDFFTSRCADPVAQLVMFRYPPPSTQEQRGCGAHTDCGFLTFVSQDSPGIEVLTKGGDWVSAPPLEGALLVNLGDMMQVWANDEYVSTVHRVVNRGDKPRASLAFFCNTDFDALVEKIPTLPGLPRHAPIKAGEYILRKLGLMYS